MTDSKKQDNRFSNSAQTSENTQNANQKNGTAGDTPRSSNPAGTRVETQTKAPSGANQEVWQQAEAQVVNTFGGLDDEAKTKAVQARYDSMVASDQQVKDWAGNDSAILGDVGQKKDS